MKLPLALRLKLSTYERLAPRKGGKFVADIFTTPRAHKQPEWEKALVATAKPISFKEGLAGLEWGNEAGPIVVLIHGWEGRGAQMGFFVDPLVAKGYRVVAIDGPGHGNSAGKYANPYIFARALMAVQGELGPFKAVIGHSMGGAAAKVGLSLGMKADKIVVLGAPSSLPEVFKRFCDLLGLGPKLRIAFHDEMSARNAGLLINLEALLPNAANIRTPVFIVHDINDREIPLADAQLALRAYPNASLLEVDAGGHRKMLKSAAVVAAVTDFVAAR